MDDRTFELADAPQEIETGPYAGYDESALGVECAWPSAEREVPGTLH